MRPALLDDAWPEEPDMEDVKHSDTEPTTVAVSARLQSIENVEKKEELLILMENMQREFTERLSIMLIIVMGCLTVMFMHVENLRRQVSRLQVGVLRQM